MNDVSKLLGCRFFKRNDTDIEVVKVISFVNESTARVINLKTKKQYKESFSVLLNDYNLLNPDAYIMFSIVTYNNIEDVIISTYRCGDIYNDTNGMPYCVARQNIVNIYNEMIKKYDHLTSVGMCMTIETVPEGLDYKSILVCNEVKMFTSVAYYIDDKLEDILQCIRKIDKYNTVLRNLFDSNYKKLNPMLIEIEHVDKLDIYGGFCKTLPLFIDNCEMMKDIRHGFNISTVTFSVEDDQIEDDHVNLTHEQFLELCNEYEVDLYNPVIVQYAKDIDITKIEQDFVMFCDAKENVYLVIYDS